MSDDQLVSILVEANVLTALASAESARTKLLVVEGLKHRVDKKELENPLRDYVARNPWLLGPQWETYKQETSVTNLLKAARKGAGIADPEAWPKRIDLALSAGKTLLIVEFMRPGITVDFDHLSRWETTRPVQNTRLGSVPCPQLMCSHAEPSYAHESSMAPGARRPRCRPRRARSLGAVQGR